MPGVAREVRDTLRRVEKLEREISLKLAEVRELQDELQAIKRRVDAEQESPVAGRLFDFLECVRRAMFAARACLPRAAGATKAGPSGEGFKGLVVAMRAIGTFMEDPELADGLLVSVGDEQCLAVDRVLAEIRVAKHNHPPSGSAAA